MKLSILYYLKLVSYMCFPLQAEFSKKKKKKKKKILHRVRKESKRSFLKRKKAHQKEERARNDSVKLKEKEIKRKIMMWQKKAGSQNRI